MEESRARAANLPPPAKNIDFISVTVSGVFDLEGPQGVPRAAESQRPSSKCLEALEASRPRPPCRNGQPTLWRPHDRVSRQFTPPAQHPAPGETNPHCVRDWCTARPSAGPTDKTFRDGGAPPGQSGASATIASPWDRASTVATRTVRGRLAARSACKEGKVSKGPLSTSATRLSCSWQTRSQDAC